MEGGWDFEGSRPPQEGSLGKAKVQNRARIDCLWKCETQRISRGKQPVLQGPL